MLEESEARQRILDTVEAGAVTWVPLELALDQVLAQDMTGAIDSPPFDNSSMDGYAVRAEEAQAGSALRVRDEEQPAGLDLSLACESGEAIRIFTGAPIPRGADAVIMQEDVIREGNQVTISEGVEVGENIRRRGGDVCAGQTLLKRGDLVTPARIGLLASQGVPEIPVHARPLIQIITTGDELVDPGAPLIPGEIYNSNSPMLQALVCRSGGIAATSHALDDPTHLRETMERAFAASDLVVIAGGVSVGDRDYVKEVLGELGVELNFWRVKLKPGKPFLFGRHPEGTHVFGLPGNPVSAFVTALTTCEESGKADEFVSPGPSSPMPSSDSAKRTASSGWNRRRGCPREKPSSFAKMRLEEDVRKGGFQLPLLHRRRDRISSPCNAR